MENSQDSPLNLGADVAVDDGHEDKPKHTLAPKALELSPGDWMRKNLFSSKFNGFLTIVSLLIVLAVMRGLLGFIFNPTRRWDATATNLRLLMTQGYPQEQYVRIWFSLGIIMALAGLSLAAWKFVAEIPAKAVGGRIMGMGAAIALVGILAPFSWSARIQYWIVALIVAAIGYVVITMLAGETISGLVLTVIAGSLGVLSLWVVPYGHHTIREGVLIAESGTVAATTKGPWTVMLILAVVAYFVGKALVNVVPPNALRGLLTLSWLLSPMVIVFLVLRDPAFDYGHILAVEIPLFVGFAVGGGLLLYLLANPRIGEIGRIIAAVVMLVAVLSFLVEMRQVFRITLLMGGLFALAAPSFSGEHKARVRYCMYWVATLLVVVWLVTAVNTPSTVQSEGGFFVGGLAVTMIVAAFTMIFSFPLGVLLALARTSKMPLFRVMATTYIEIIRGIPLITVLIFFSVMVPLFLPESMELDEIAAVVVGFTLFSAAYLAENVRGGLQAVRQGQYEAADALGLTTAQRTGFIVLPQALRVSIPPLVGQTIATFKETSLLSIIGVFDLLYVARFVIPGQGLFLGSAREQLLVASLIYWVFAYSMSKASMRLERRLGVGER